MLVLNQPAQNAAKARGDEVGRVAKEDGGLVATFRVLPRTLVDVCISFKNKIELFYSSTRKRTMSFMILMASLMADA